MWFNLYRTNFFLVSFVWDHYYYVIITLVPIFGIIFLHKVPPIRFVCICHGLGCFCPSNHDFDFLNLYLLPLIFVIDQSDGWQGDTLGVVSQFLLYFILLHWSVLWPVLLWLSLVKIYLSCQLASI